MHGEAEWSCGRVSSQYLKAVGSIVLFSRRLSGQITYFFPKLYFLSCKMLRDSEVRSVDTRAIREAEGGLFMLSNHTVILIFSSGFYTILVAA